MTYAVVAALVLSLVVRCWTRHPAPQWITRWIDRLWVLFGMTFLIGILLAFVNTTTTILPDGRLRYTASTPDEIRYILAAISIPLAILAIVGSIHVVRLREVQAEAPRQQHCFSVSSAA
jgi:hypothetical protein